MKVTELLPCEALAQVMVHRPGAQTAGEGGKPVETTTEEATITLQVTKLSGGQAQRAYGDQAQAKWRVLADDDADVMVNDLLEVLSGPYTGTMLEVDDIRAPLNALKVLQVSDTERVPD
jgi:hypothetical protein